MGHTRLTTLGVSCERSACERRLYAVVHLMADFGSVDLCKTRLEIRTRAVIFDLH